MTGSVEDAKFLVAYFQRLTIFDVDAHVRSRRQTMHPDRRTGKLAQLYRAAAMIGVSVGVDDQIQTPSVIREDREVALDLVAQRIDDGSLAGCFTRSQDRFCTCPD